MSHWEAAGRSDEWYTPAYIFAALGCHFSMDVAPARLGKSSVSADVLLAGDGLVEPWSGFVWMNPPFGGRGSLAPWIDRFFDHGNGIALTPDRTSAPWFRAAWERADLVLFTPKVRFIRPDGSEGKSPSNGTALWAAGERAAAALRRAARKGLGIIASPERAAA